MANQLLRATFKIGDDLVWLGQVAATRGIELSLEDEDRLLRDEIKGKLPVRGISYYWRLGDLMEAVMTPSQSRSVLLVLVESLLMQLAPCSHLVVVDPYLFPSNRTPSYEAELLSAMAVILPGCTELVFVVRPNHDSAFAASLQGQLKAQFAGLSIRLVTSSDWHDRFWIADRARGLFVGTSFNGIGSRYALADFLSGGDVSDLVVELAKYGAA